MQTPNSPDINLLDLGFLRAIQSFNDAAPRNKEELIQSVSMAYDNYLQHKLNCTWLTLQSCFNQIIIHNRDNDYNIEHILKEKLECGGQLPDVLVWWRKQMNYLTSTTQMMKQMTQTTKVTM